MAFAPGSPITGAAITGLTTPTYTIAADTPPNAVSKQYAVSALGGTQTGVTVHSISSPFTLTAFRPANFKVLGQPGPTGQVRAFPKNTFEVLVRKGMSVLANQPIQVGMVRVSISIPAGADAYDKPNIYAMLSAAFGLAWAQAQGLSDLSVTGTL